MFGIEIACVGVPTSKFLWTIIPGDFSSIEIHKELIQILPQGLRLPPFIFFPGPKESFHISRIPKICHHTKRIILKIGNENWRVLPSGNSWFLVPCIARKPRYPAILNFPKAMLLDQSLFSWANFQMLEPRMFSLKWTRDCLG